MAERSYIDFDLEIEWVGSGYRARVLESPVGQAQAEISLPFTDLEIENFVLRVGQRRRGRRRVESRDLDTAREFGAKLFQAVMHEDIAGAYRSSVLSAQEKNAGLRLRLRLSGAPDLVDIPWEFLFDPSARRFVALSTDSPIVRFLDVPGTTDPLKIELPIKVLVVIASPSDFEPLQVEDEWARLQEALAPGQANGMLSLERLAKPTLTELQRAIRRDYNVLHFVGHGGFDEKSEDGLLVFEDDQGRGNEVSATYLSTLLHDADSLRLAVLNACDGARSSKHDQFAGVAQSLLQQGVPAVVAMQFEISDEAALTFAREFYGAFAEGYPVEAALAEARKSMFAQQNDSEWATPVLYLRSPGESIFEILPRPAPPIVAAVTPAPAAPDPAPVPELGFEPGVAAAIVVEPAPPSEPEPVARTVIVPAPEVPPPLAPEPAIVNRGPATHTPEPPTGSPVSAGGVGGGPMPAPRRDDGPGWWDKFGKKGAIGLGSALLLFFVGGLAFLAVDSLKNGDDPPIGPEEAPTATVGPGTPRPVELADFDGEWWTNFARLELSEEGEIANGHYFPFLGGNPSKLIEGFVAGRDFHGTIDGGAGRVLLTMSDDGDSFYGHWEGSDGSLHEWCGQRDDELEDGCGYTGSWKTKGLPEEVDAPVFWITQTANAATLELGSTKFGDVTLEMQFDSASLASAFGTLTLEPENGEPLRFTVSFDLVDEVNWDSLKGTWAPTSPASTGPSDWCAWRGEAPPPC